MTIKKNLIAGKILKETSADYLRHNLREIIETVLNGNNVVLRYGRKKQILLTNLEENLPNPKPTKHQMLVDYIQSGVQTGKQNKRPASYKNNREMYDDLLTTFLGKYDSKDK